MKLKPIEKGQTIEDGVIYGSHTLRQQKKCYQQEPIDQVKEGDIQKSIQVNRNRLFQEQRIKLEKAYKNRHCSEFGPLDRNIKKKKIIVKHLINNSSSRMVQFNN